MADETDAGIPGNNDSHLLDAADRIAAQIVAEAEAPPRDPATGKFTKSETAAPEGVTEEDAAPAETQPSGEDEGTDEPDENPPIEPPLSWSKEQREHWSNLPRETQEFIHSREQERDAEVRRGQNEAAEKRKAADAEREAASQERQKYADTLKLVSQYAMAMDPIIAEGNQTDWAKLAEDDPVVAFQKKAAYDQRTQLLNAVQAEYARVADQQMRAYAEEQSKLLAQAIPDFADPAKGKARRDGYDPILTDAGYSRAEIDQFWKGFDHRMVKVIEEAAAYRKMKAAQKTVATKKAAPPASVTKPKASDGKPKESAQLAALRQQAKANPHDLRTQADFVLAQIMENPQ